MSYRCCEYLRKKREEPDTDQNNVGPLDPLDIEQQECYDQAVCHEWWYTKYKNQYFFVAFLPIAFISALQSIVSTSVKSEDYPYKDAAISCLALANGIIAAIAGYWKWDQLAEKHLTAVRSWLELAETLEKDILDATKTGDMEGLKHEFATKRLAIEGVAPITREHIHITRKRLAKKKTNSPQRFMAEGSETPVRSPTNYKQGIGKTADPMHRAQRPTDGGTTIDGTATGKQPSTAEGTESKDLAQPGLPGSALNAFQPLTERIEVRSIGVTQPADAAGAYRAWNSDGHPEPPDC